MRSKSPLPGPIGRQVAEFNFFPNSAASAVQLLGLIIALVYHRQLCADCRQ